MAAQTDDPKMVVRTIRIAAPPAFVFPYFTDPEKLVRWMGVEATLDPEPNGEFRVRINDAHTTVGEYVEIEVARASGSYLVMGRRCQLADRFERWT